MRDGYSIKRIKDICEKGSSNIAQKDLEGHDGDYPIYGASGFIKNVDFYHQAKEYVGIVKDGSGIGRVDFYPPKSSLIGTLQYIIPRADYDIRYVGYCLQSLNLASYRQGAAIPHIYFRDYGEMEVLVAESIPEQQRIVGILDQEFAKIDELKAKAEKSIQAAKDLFASIQTLVLENNSWKVYLLNDVCSLITDGTHKTPKYQESGVPFLSVKNITGGFIDMVDTRFISKEEHKELSKRCKPEYGDILYSKVGTTGVAKVIDTYDEFSIFVSLALLKVKHDIVKSTMLEKILNAPYVRKQAQQRTRGPANKNFVIRDIKQVCVRIPHYDEQETVEQLLDTYSEKIIAILQNYQKSLTLCDDLKQALLRKAFSGEL